MSTVGQVLPFIAVGIVLALLVARPLNAMGMGDDTARALGAHVGRTRAVAMLAVTLLCGAATAACGPIVFVGLMVPHIVRSFTGPDQRWILPYATILSPVLLLGADVIGRVVARPAELQVGIVTALIGGPLFIFLVRRRRMAQL
jgi:iron complex transport system permease protein